MKKSIRFVQDDLSGSPIRSDSSIYLCPDAPYWFVANDNGQNMLQYAGGSFEVSQAGKDELIQFYQNGSEKSYLSCAVAVEHFFQSLELPCSADYHGRADLQMENLSELWLHITDNCNLRCKHCLFGDNFAKKRELPRDTLKSLVEEAVGLGCRLLCFTGGEPFLYPEFLEIMAWALTFDHLQIAILTNGIFIEEHLEKLAGLDRKRLHFQISLEGPEKQNDAIRGQGSFARAAKAIELLQERGFSVTVALTVGKENVPYLPELFSVLAGLKVKNVHFQYHFQRGFGQDLEMAIEDFRKILPSLLTAAVLNGISIDNVEAIRSQVFTPPGTRFDFGNGGWQSLAVGPDGNIYPTPATVDVDYLRSGKIEDGLEKVWRHSPILQNIRELSLMDVPAMAADPYRFLLGGGDLDHCLKPGENCSGLTLELDPYAGISRDIARHLIAAEAACLPEIESPAIKLRMGDISSRCSTGDEVNFTRCNCLLSMGEGPHGLVRNFYGARAEETDETILNPVHYDDAAAMIPAEARGRRYGCGSPVEDADIQPRQTVVDLGSGSGVECFLASRKVGRDGKVFGIDMTERMIDLAKRTSASVSRELGYHNVYFKKGFLENIPLADSSADIVISNCVVNLSENKRQVFQEILRILKPGGRMVISDVVSENEPPAKIRNDQKLFGECLGGAMVQQYLLAVLRDMGFENIQVLKRFPYREKEGHHFYSMTYSANKPAILKERQQDILYAGPFSLLVNGSGGVLSRGKRMRVSSKELAMDNAELALHNIFSVDKSGIVTNIEASCGCDCSLPLSPTENNDADAGKVHRNGCLICGEDLEYLPVTEDQKCVKCGLVTSANSICRNDHFVCDQCHIQDPLAIIKEICFDSRETDMIKLADHIRGKETFPMHGPEHHILVPAVILTCYRNLGGKVTEEQISQAIERGSQIPGGACGFMGICGAASGAGIGFSILLESSPLTPRPRQKVQQLVAEILTEIAGHKAARCCQRECYKTLFKVAEISKDLLPLPLKVEAEPVCSQFHHNSECIRKSCPYYKGEKNHLPKNLL